MFIWKQGIKILQTQTVCVICMVATRFMCIKQQTNKNLG